MTRSRIDPNGKTHEIGMPHETRYDDMTRRIKAMRLVLPLGFALACQPGIPAPRAGLDASQQLVVVVTPGWNSTIGTMMRFERATPTAAWNRLGNPIPLVVGRTGIAWGVGFDDVSTEGPHKHEGDGEAPAGIFPLDTAFGFAPADSMRSVQLPYVQLLPTTDCVDDTTSAHYNTVVDKAAVPRVDWNSAEHMRQVSQYEIGVIVGYNASPPIKFRRHWVLVFLARFCTDPAPPPISSNPIGGKLSPENSLAIPGAP